MRTLDIGTRNYTKVVAVDEKGQGNANHHYEISVVDTHKTGNENGFCTAGMTVLFQNGPIKEVGVNGVMNEDLIAIVIDRMRGFQSGDYACPENATALLSLENALFELNSRTKQREKCGVEGTSKVHESFEGNFDKDSTVLDCHNVHESIFLKFMERHSGKVFNFQEGSITAVEKDDFTKPIQHTHCVDCGKKLPPLPDNQKPCPAGYKCKTCFKKPQTQ